MNGYAVGRLVRVSQGQLRFQYDPSWLANEAAIPISLSMPLSPDPYSGDTVWNYFDNLLPDNRDLRARLGVVLGSESTRPFDLLESMGRDCVGALQLTPPPAGGGQADEAGNPLDVRHVDARTVDEAWIAETLRAYGTRPLGMQRDGEFRISIAGAQEKTALLWHAGSWHEPRGATPTTHILKLPIGPVASGVDLTDSVENEWLCLRIAREFGLQVPEARIEEFHGVRALVVERFDRKWSDDGSWLIRLPQEDCCQALGIPPGKKYESDGGPGIADIMKLLLQSEAPMDDRRAFFRAVVVYWLLAAIDGHAKNFSLFLFAGGRCRLTPFYDILSAYPIVDRKQLHERELKMAMAVSGKNSHYLWWEIQGRHWIETARRVGFPPEEATRILRDCVERGPEALRTVQAELPEGFPTEVSEPVFAGVAQALGRTRNLSAAH